MKLDIDYSDLDIWLRFGTGQFFAKYAVVKKNMQKVTNYIQSYFKVDFFEGGFEYPAYTCGDYKVNFTKGSTTGDLYVKVMVETNQAAYYAAAASICLRWAITGRPLVGLVLVNEYGVGYRPQNDYSYFQIILHEFFHALGFFKYVFEEFPIVPSDYSYLSEWKTQNMTLNMTVAKGNSTLTMRAVNITQVVQFAQSHYGCATMTAMPLEDKGAGGTANNHWKKLFTGNEIMNPTTDNRMKISKLSLTALQATGWYNIS